MPELLEFLLPPPPTLLLLLLLFIRLLLKLLSELFRVTVEFAKGPGSRIKSDSEIRSSGSSSIKFRKPAHIHTHIYAHI